jgi:citrate synthase
MTALDPALLAVLVVAGIGIVLWTVLFAAGRLIGLSSNWRKPQNVTRGQTARDSFRTWSR